ncbi:MAG: hypothetical protein KKG43_06565 [Candidatus Omnitrophica bacterium]|nr:hypothetical protein [Candidatus Omnitrophota bacterium]MBU1928908.1 hypothetical protein [Candidatus Omnitrophota bacterium]MBU2034634.1 hypothetical protein [Candidatus Omnitrophota bacterium]MBU2222321.1 hypothetical protein [Candidatus Omnitrophota bacterium]MBU2257519.1 hypothetical protein [Candidatus Omnitrophota bacterium]
MDNKEPQNCWEFYNCPEETRKKCPAFPSDGKKCWEVAGSFDGLGCPKTKGMGMMFCVRNCVWFKKMFNPTDNK